MQPPHADGYRKKYGGGKNFRSLDPLKNSATLYLESVKIAIIAKNIVSRCHSTNQEVTMKPSSPDQSTPLLAISDQCVMCGMCSPHCPTYNKTHNEAESPRGRISLIQAMLRGELPLTSSLQQHLDSCLSCRACEAICPSGVKYGELIDGVRALQRQQSSHEKWAKEKLLETTSSKKRLKNSAKLLRLAQLSGIGTLLKKGVEHYIYSDTHTSQLIPDNIPAYKKWQANYPAIGEQRGHVALFTGCIADIVDQGTLQDAIILLNHCGYEVSVPAQQQCCGALHQHSGDQTRSHQLAQANLQAFTHEPYDHIIHCATGCGAHLMEYPQLVGQAARDFSEKVDEISHFLLNNGIKQLNFSSSHEKVAIHLPCTQKNVLKQPNSSSSLLELIPNLKAEPLAGNNLCCGAAGSYMLEHPKMAQQLRQDKLDALQPNPPKYLVSSNIGCAMHLASGLRENGQPVEVIHPISLLARQLII